MPAACRALEPRPTKAAPQGLRRDRVFVILRILKTFAWVYGLEAAHSGQRIRFLERGCILLDFGRV
jgi:hypothetical protein